MKAYCLVFVFALGTLPAAAHELPQTGNASRASEIELAQPGSFHWSDAESPATNHYGSAPAASGPEKSAPARAAMAQMRAETARILRDADANATRVSRIRYDLHVTCVVEQVEPEPDLSTAGSHANAAMPWIWSVQHASNRAEMTDTATVEVCEVDYTRRVRSFADENPANGGPDTVGFKVAFPAD